MGRRSGTCIALLCSVLASACSHTDQVGFTPELLGPRSSATPAQLTFNVEQDYWPQWTEDGAGILYAYVPVGTDLRHRCVGLLPANGGTQLWHMCENRTGLADSAASFGAFAVSSTGELLYTEGVSTFNSTSPLETHLWLADTAHPFVRTDLLSLPVLAGTVNVDWLSDLQWTGPTSFIALGQVFGIATDPQPPCAFQQDTILDDAGVVVTGSIVNGKATVQLLVGSEGASGYSLADNGQSVVITRTTDLRLFRIPLQGGAVTPTAAVAPSSARLLGVSCRASTCVVADDAVSRSGEVPGACGLTRHTLQELRSVSLETGTVQLLATSPSDVITTPKVSPMSGDVVVAMGGNLGHAQTVHLPTNGNLWLYRGLLP